MSKPKTPADSQDVLRRVVDLIRSSDLEAGDRLPSIRQLAARLEVSTNHVRDALVQARALGLIRIHPRSGAFVEALNNGSLIEALSNTLPTSLRQTDQNLLYLLDARRLIETETVTQAAARRRVEDLLPVREALEAMSSAGREENAEGFVEADVQFHLAAARACGNTVLMVMLDSLLGLLRPYLLGLPWTAERRTRTEQSHRAMYNAMVAGDVEAARAAIGNHLGLAREGLVRYLQAPVQTA